VVFSQVESETVAQISLVLFQVYEDNVACITQIEGDILKVIELNNFTKILL
jgi:hypothetical protein